MFGDGFSDSSGSSQFGVEPNLRVPIQSGLLPCPDCGVELPASARVCPHDGSDLLLHDGRIFADKYELGSVIGFGGMGVIYRARHLILDKIVAIKVLHSASASSKLIMRFQREAKAASSLSHPNVITVYDFGVLDDTQPYMVMDYLDGMTLADHLSQTGPLPIRDALEIMEQVTAALAHAHRKGVLHRDLKPGNIMLVEGDDGNRQVKILDFGLAKLLDSDDPCSMSAPGSAMGSPAYMSPEQATGLLVDARADLYSLGCIFYELLTGSPPLIADSPMQTLLNRLNTEVPPLHSSGYNYPPSVERIVEKLLRKEPRFRFQSADDLRYALAELWSLITKWERAQEAPSSETTKTGNNRQKHSSAYRTSNTLAGHYSGKSTRKEHGTRKAISRPVKTVPDWKGSNTAQEALETLKSRVECPNLTRTKNTDTVHPQNQRYQTARRPQHWQTATQCLSLAQLQRLDLLPLILVALTIVVTILILVSLR